MLFLSFALLALVSFAVVPSVEVENRRLKMTNRALLKALRSLTSETGLGSFVPQKEVGLKFTENNEWVRDNGDGTVTLGISEYWQEMMREIVFVELPDMDDKVDAGEYVGMIESVSTSEYIFAPVTGSIVAINEELKDHPVLINEEPYDGGWIMKIKLSDPAELTDLLDADQYRQIIEGQTEETALAKENKRLQQANKALRKALEELTA